MRSTLLFVVLLMLSFRVLAQVEPIVFEEKEYDFGVIKEGDGPVTHEFLFLNNSNAPVKILNVQASCGCTTPGWSKEEIAPGKSGFVKAQYNPYNRPGPFNKTLTVRTNLNQNIILRIRGSVEPRVKTVEEQFPTAIGNLRFKSSSFNLGRITPHAPVTREFEVLNYGEEPVKFMNIVDAPTYIQVDFSTQEIQPKEQAKIVITYDAAKRNDMGFLIDDFSIMTNDSKDAKKEFKVYATVDPYIPPMTAEQRMQAPHLEVEKDVADFGSIQTGEKIDQIYTLKNTGKTKLDLVMIKPSCDCIKIMSAIESIEPGASVDLKVTFDASGLRGTQQKYLTVFSNDPSGPAKRLILKGVVN